MNEYAGWRTAALAESFLHETRDGLPGERLLQVVWQHQRLRHQTLTLTDGRCVRVLHPGFWNRGAGPDFRDAVIRLDDAPAATGDIEIDLRTTAWRTHHHEFNPSYQRVILHVVWQVDAAVPSAPLPILPLEGRLDAPLDELIAWVDLDPGLPDNVIGRCASSLRRLGNDATVPLLEEAALFRFHRKGMELAARAREAGWEQALWEALGAGLGYQHNVWPMRRVAEQRATLDVNPPIQLLDLQARVLGLAGLLPHEPTRAKPKADIYLRRLWEIWWRERQSLDSVALPKSVWHLGGCRPANHPQRRLALLAHWLLQPDFVPRLEAWFAAPRPSRHLQSSLLDCLQVEDDPYWCSHWTLSSQAMAHPQPLLGESRLADLAVNGILPWFWTRAAAGNNQPLALEAERRFLDWPAAQDNAVLRLARLRLFGGDARRCAWTAARQQGLLQLVRDFCGHSNALCDACVLPDHLRTSTSVA